MSAAQTVAEYGQRIGQPGLRLPAEGPMVLQDLDGAPLLLEATADVLRVYLLVKAPHWMPQALLGALQAADLRRVGAQSWPVRVGLRGQGEELRVMFMVCLSERQASVQTLVQAVDLLRRTRQTHLPLHTAA